MQLRQPPLIPTKEGFFKYGISRLSYRTWLFIDTKEKVTGRSIVSNPVKWLSPPRVVNRIQEVKLKEIVVEEDME